MNVNCQSSSIFYKFDSEAVRDGIFFIFFYFFKDGVRHTVGRLDG